MSLIRRLLAACVATVAAAWVVAPLLASGAVAQPAACLPPQKPVFVGGYNGFDSFIDPAATARLRATGKVGLYIHGSALSPSLFTKGPGLPADVNSNLNQIYRNFADTGQGVIEIGYGGSGMDNPYFTGDAGPGQQNQFLSFFTSIGEHPWAALVNAPDDFRPDRTTQTVADWQRQAAKARTLGVSAFVPLISPNDDVGVDENPATAPGWALARNVALAMGSVAIDAPADYFLRANTAAGGTPPGENYRRWLVNWVHWAATAHLRIFWLISPGWSGPHFLADTQEMVAYLSAHDALPHHWVAENYDTSSMIAEVHDVQGTAYPVTNPGEGYTSARVVVSSPNVAWGTQATATAVIMGGRLHQVNVQDPGSGYMTATAQIVGDGHGAAVRVIVQSRDGNVAPAGGHTLGDRSLPIPTVVGREDLPGSVAAIAIWVAAHAPVRPQTGLRDACGG